MNARYSHVSCAEGVFAPHIFEIYFCVSCDQATVVATPLKKVPPKGKKIAVPQGIVLYCTVLYCTVLYCTVQYCAALYCTVLYCTVLYLEPLRESHYSR